MKKFWKVILGIGGVIGTILIFFLGRKKSNIKTTIEGDISRKNKDIDKLKKKSLEIEVEKTKIEEKITNTSNKISETQSHVIDTKSAKSTVSDFEDKYRKK